MIYIHMIDAIGELCSIVVEDLDEDHEKRANSHSSTLPKPKITSRRVLRVEICCSLIDSIVPLQPSN